MITGAGDHGLGDKVYVMRQTVHITDLPGVISCGNMREACNKGYCQRVSSTINDPY